MTHVEERKRKVVALEVIYADIDDESNFYKAEYYRNLPDNTMILVQVKHEPMLKTVVLKVKGAMHFLTSAITDMIEEAVEKSDQVMEEAITDIKQTPAIDDSCLKLLAIALKPELIKEI